MRPVPLTHEGATLVGELYLPQGAGPHPAVLIAHSGLGLLAHERRVASDFAALGYTALAIDMYGGDVDGSPEKAGGFFAALTGNPALLRSRVAAWFTYVASLPDVDASRIAIIGYCFGGMCALELARSGADVRAAVSFHGILTTTSPAQQGAIPGEIVAWCGGDDPYAPSDQIEGFRAEMAKAGARCQITVFGTVGHGFADLASDALGRDDIAYDALADKVSWAGTVALLEGVLKG